MKIRPVFAYYWCFIRSPFLPPVEGGHGLTKSSGRGPKGTNRPNFIAHRSAPPGKFSARIGLMGKK